MNRLNIILSNYLVLFLIVLFPALGISQENKSDLDIVNDIHYIASLIEEHKSNYGHYPFAENWINVEKDMVAVPVLINISKYELPENLNYPPPGMSGVVLTTEYFESYLNKSLNRPIIIPRDDRVVKGPNGIVPHFYQFLFDGSNYFISGYLTTDFPNSRKLGYGLYKYEVASIAIPDRKIQKYSEISNK
jgi:hypothetical protein